MCHGVCALALAAMTWCAAATEFDCSQTSGTLTLSSDLTCTNYRNIQWNTLVIVGSSVAGTEWSLCAGSRCVLSIESNHDQYFDVGSGRLELRNLNIRLDSSSKLVRSSSGGYIEFLNCEVNNGHSSNGGVIEVCSSTATIKITSSTVTDCEASNGGVIFIDGSSGSTITLTDSTFYENSACVPMPFPLDSPSRSIKLPLCACRQVQRRCDLPQFGHDRDGRQILLS